MSKKIPLVALIGLPNAGKSTLLNRLTGSRKAIVAKEEHTTRDLNYGEDYWEGMFIRFVDTGGLVPDPSDKIQKEVQVRSWAAIAEADLLVWVIDRKQDPDTISEKIIQRIWKSGKPFIICINKVDDPNLDKDISDYARLGGLEFVNVSSTTGYNLNVLMDEIVEEVQRLGFEKQEMELDTYQKTKSKRSRTKEVKRHESGGYYVVRNEEGLFESVSKYQNEEGEKIKDNISGAQSIVIDLFGVVCNEKLEENTPVIEFLQTEKEAGRQILFLSNVGEETFQEIQQKTWFDVFDGGVTSFEAGFSKPNEEIFAYLCEKYDLSPAEIVFLDDIEEHVEVAKDLGMEAYLYSPEVLDDLRMQLKPVKDEGESKPAPKILLLGKPNVGKSSLFNAMVGQEIQIVTDIPGTTLSVNDTLVERVVSEGRSKVRQYVLLDSTGIRKPGQRTFGAENFATFRTIQSAYEADVICLILDGSQPLTHQDQVVAGICKQARKGVVIIANKSDAVDAQVRAKFERDFYNKFQFLKINKFIWVSAERRQNLEMIWQEIDNALKNREKVIERAELRKLFNYLMKQKPPNKLRTKKRPVVYDLLYTRSKPPTFELLVKDKTSIHWSYLRFLENIIRQNFGFESTEIVVRLSEVKRRDVLS